MIIMNTPTRREAAIAMHRALCVLTLYEPTRRFLQEHDPNALKQAEEALKLAEAVPDESSKPFVIKQITTAPIPDQHAFKPFLFAIVDDGHTRDHVRFWNWLECRWEPLEEIGRVS